MLQERFKFRQPESPTLAAAVMSVAFALLLGRNLKWPQGNEYRGSYVFQPHPNLAIPGKTEFDGVAPVRRP